MFVVIVLPFSGRLYPVNLYFASPNIPNAEVFLELFEKSQDEVMVISDSPVAQNRYFFDFIDHQAILFSDTGVDVKLPYDTTTSDGFLGKFLKDAGKDVQNIVYCNTIEDTINSFDAILNGQGDQIPENLFLYAGNFDEVLKRYNEMKK